MLSNSGCLIGIVLAFLVQLPDAAILDLSHADLSASLNASIFNGIDLSNITLLNLSSNSLTGFNDDLVLSAFSSLEILDLSRNFITEIPDRLFSQLVNLRVINLAQNRLVTLPNYFLNNTSCETLDLNHNRVSRFVNSTFSNQYKTLKYLDLTSNGILSLDENVFLATPRLTVLKLNNNSLTDFAQNSFRNLHNLTTIEFSMNFFSRFPSKSLINGNVESLTTILAAGNVWENFSDSDFVGGQSIQTLDISGHTVELFSPNAFSDLRSLRNLNFRQSKVKWLPPFLLANLTSYNTTIHFEDWPSLQCAPFMPPRCSICRFPTLPICPVNMPLQIPPSTAQPGRASVQPVNLQYNVDLNFSLRKTWSVTNITVELKIELSEGFEIDSTILDILLPVNVNESRNTTLVATRIRSGTSNLQKLVINKINNDLVDPSSNMRSKTILQTLDSDSIRVLQYCNRDGTVAINRFDTCPSDLAHPSSESPNNSVIIIVGIIIGVVVLIFLGAVLREVIMKCRGPAIPVVDHRIKGSTKGKGHRV